MSRDPRSWRRHDVVEYWDAPEAAGLDFEQQGLRLFLLDRVWRYGSLPADRDYLVRLCAGRVRDPATIDVVVRACFQTTEAGTLVSPDIEAERARADELRATRGAAGRRAHAKPSNSSANAKHEPSKTPADVEQERSTRSDLKGDVDVDVDVDVDDDEDGDVDAGSARAKPSRQPRDSLHQTFIEFWLEAFSKAKSAPYAFQGGKDGDHVKAILEAAGGDLERAKERALALLNSKDPFHIKSGVDLGFLRSQWNRLGSAGRASPAAAPKPAGAAYSTFTPEKEG